MNKSARQKRKKEDNARLIKLCDQAYKLDPRLQKFKRQEKEEKEQKKKAKADAIQKEIDDKKQAIIDEELARLALASSEKDQGVAAKKQKDAKKKALKKLGKAVMQVVQDANYYLENISNAQFAEQVGLLARLIESFGDDSEKLTAFKDELAAGGKAVYEQYCSNL
jgi:DnaJ homolog subfamily C member 2